MTTLTRNTHWRRSLLAPVAAGSLLLLSACGQGTDQDQDAPETETAQEAETPEDTTAPQETDPAQTEDENTEAEESPAEDNEEEDEDSSGEALTLDQVEENNSPDSCWAVMNDTVYDLTDWIEDHPGGADRIEGLCGTDATEAFEGQHGGSEGPEEQLTEFEIGTLQD
ncbi:cytochrome b5 domain-containing protein [Nesterenkonia sp. E16_7]|uniref:cytochrome b5 domain-containing protein n=1 Tax=unclassified Nesterenkonia TaxID=2629769 RepID=UPI001A91160D|nr:MULTISPECIES: cytochrome b5-like heme/steroid binding domain-containing protein [unclassified Nesterenkonia]MBO0596286.1 cytochrome b5 domain-containing protein [Nesterenkonia sp. E16_10]MBO0599986.1 cytochrome b5 domain-containing protein [Nesterenkonia sp. E16_7]